MRLVSRLWVFVVVVVALGGCSEVTDAGVQLTVVATEPVDPRCGPGTCTDMPLEGAEVCETDTTNCAVTNERGTVTLALPPNEEVSWTAQKDGHEAKLFAEVSDWGTEPAFRRVGLRSDERAAAWHDHLESGYPMRGVGAVFVFLNPPFEGATFTLVGATGDPFYWVEPPAVFPATADRDLQATTSRGQGGFLNVAPGERQIEVGGTAEDCVPNGAWPGDADNRIRFLVREGHVTSVGVTCPPPL